mmetsp:Transcript_3242/g.2179  ORF Transcript_3242/g.2179 Transcript_3242/m.2179 type:complete len:119 (+) Transcript_3242:373-729(+)|eukprot:CAMPEP_0202978310 /NCGR_PEP_ID=MMETSP1396-20130829/84774_1 /ASSEMBLY_ACC=CAM_ASM_000872 /TAXON_ID= /ORGANISM="Pseudokeronopsis sp., Strain Brazil" /LENGTH=118 /DNA_ID=CAMNT_0049717237 /DNA_START=1279 /DNA_END=1635 /DNA_ORIENTATION=+
MFQSKVDQDVFDNEIAMLRALIGNLEKDEQPQPVVVDLKPSQKKSLSDKEIENLRNLLERMPEIDAVIEKILRDMKSMNIQQIRDSVTEIQKQLITLASKDELKKLYSELQEMKERLA